MSGKYKDDFFHDSLLTNGIANYKNEVVFYIISIVFKLDNNSIKIIRKLSVF